MKELMYMLLGFSIGVGLMNIHEKRAVTAASEEVAHRMTLACTDAIKQTRDAGTQSIEEIGRYCTAAMTKLRDSYTH